MLECTGDLCINKLGIPCGSKSPIAIVFIVAYESINSAIINSTGASILTLRDDSGIKVDSGLPLFYCP